MRPLFKLSIFILLTTMQSVSAQAPDTLWTRIYGGPDLELAWSADQTEDDGFIMAGKTQPNLGDEDLWLVKTNSSGDTMWTRRYGDDNEPEEGRSVQPTFDTGFIICGQKGNGIWLLKTDISGDTLWTKTYQIQASEYSYEVQQTSDSGFVIVGRTQQASGLTRRDIWLLKTDAQGDTLWTRIFGGPGEDVAYSVKQTFDGGYIIAGETQSFGSGREDFWLIKTDASGDTLWTRTYGGIEEDVAWSVIQSSDSGFVICGHTESDITFTDVKLIKTDRMGDTLWTKIYAREGNEIGYSVVETLDGGYAICSEMDNNVWLIKTDALGDTVWTTAFGDFSYFPYVIRQTTDGGYMIAGGKSTFAGIMEFLLIRYAPESPQTITSAPISRQFVLHQNYPNPFNPLTTIKFSLPNSETTKIEVFNTLGQTIKTVLNTPLPAGNHELTVNAENLPSGIYFYRIQAGEFQDVKKMVLLK